jgi:hypothetical protein
MSALSELDRVYLAGLFDGEGSVSIISGCLRITITNRNADVLRWIQGVYGGGLNSRPDGWRPGWRENHCLTITTRKAARFLADVLPFLRIKKAQAEIGLLVQSSTKWGGRADRSEWFQKREMLRQELLRLNGKNVPKGSHDQAGAA